MSLEGKVVIVTGGGMGIGRYVALGCAKRGAQVAIADYDDEALAAVEAELRELTSAVVAKRTDVREEDDVSALMSQVASSFGKIDYLVNNAAIVPHFQWGGPRWPAAKNLDFSFWSNVVATNLHGTFLCCKHVVPYMERERSGHIVNMHGGGALTPPGAMAYVVTKEAGVTLTRFLAEEVRECNICVMSLSPGGAIATERAPAEARARMPSPESAGDRFFIAADAGMELSGHLVDFVDGQLVPLN